MTILKKLTGRSAIASMIGAVALVGAFSLQSIARDWGPYQVDDRRSGYTYMTDETRAVQDDDFENPGMLWVENGQNLWSKKGANGKSCASCHANPDKDMKGVGPSFPKFVAKLGKLESLEQKINRERAEKLGEKKPLKFDSKAMLSLTSYINNISKGMKINVKVDGKAKPFFEKGKAFYYQRRGQLNLACKHCHEDHAGDMIRANRLSQGKINGFPTYRLKWQKPGSVHRRFRGCNKQVRATPYKAGSDEYVNLELYVKWRGRGLPVETPAVRN